MLITFERNIFSAQFVLLYLLKLKNQKTMSTLKFSDGEEFNTSGPLRKEERYDGWYVIGQGYLIPVDSEEDADKMLVKLMPAISC